jgi:hypothetical protein
MSSDAEAPDGSAHDGPDVTITSGSESSGPLAPNRDEVLPFLPVGPSAGADDGQAEDEDSTGAAAVPLGYGIFTVTPIPHGSTRDVLVYESQRLSTAPEDEHLHPLDLPEKERVYRVAADFVRDHVRVIAKNYALRGPHKHFEVGTVVISENIIPRTALRHASLQWAIARDGTVAELKTARLPVSHLAPLADVGPPDLATLHRGDTSDAAFLLAAFCHLVGAAPTTSVAATGAIALHTNAVAYVPDIGPLLAAAHDDGMTHLILPSHNGKIDGLHGGVRYWPVRDTNEAVFSLLALMAHTSIVPNIRRRALTKQAYAWASLLSILVAIMGYQLAASLSVGGAPPVDFVRYLLIVVVVLFIGSFVFTHRFWRRDR